MYAELQTVELEVRFECNTGTSKSGTNRIGIKVAQNPVRVGEASSRFA